MKEDKTDQRLEKLIRAAPYLIAITVITSILISRILIANQALPEGESHLVARLARTFETKGILEQDHLLSGEIPVQYTMFSGTAVALTYLCGDYSATIIASIIWSLVAIISANMLLKKIGRPAHERAITLTILAITPTFIHDSLATGTRMASLALQLISAAMLLDQRKTCKTAGILSAFAAATTSPIDALTSIILNTTLMIRNKINWKWVVAAVIASVIGAAMIPHGAPITNHQSGGIAATLADIGETDGLPTFAIILGAIGLWMMWPERSAIVTIIALLGLTFYDHRFITITNMIICALAGAAALYLSQRHWKIKDLQRMSILVITCGLLFSTISAGARLTREEPSHATASSLQWLMAHSRSGEIVLSSPENGYWIQYYAVRPVSSDERLEPTDPRAKAAMDTLMTYNTQTAENYLRAYNITYVYITPEMKNGTIWQAPNQGLHYVLFDDQTFKKVYQSDGIEIYEYLNKPYRRRIQ